MDDTKTKAGDISDEDVIKRLEAWFPNAQKYWKPHHEAFNKIKKFTKVHGDGAQWDKSAFDSRNNSSPPRITLTENLLGPFVAQVVNDIKRSNFAIQVKPRDEGTDINLAKVRQGLLRGVQMNGGWQQALGQAADDQVTGGLGAFRLITKYADPKSFRKELKYIALDDPTRMLHGDGTHQESDYSDVTDSLVYEPYSNDRFKAEFDKDPKEFLSRNDTSPVWGNHNGPWVSEYFFKQDIPDELVMYGKEEIFLSELADKTKNDAKAIGLKSHEDLITTDKDGNQIRRETTRCQIWWCKVAGKQVLKKEKWPGYWIPNFVVNGRKVVVDGETFFYGLAAPAVDAQKRHNFAVSAHTERLALSPKAPIWAAVESIPTGMQGDWDNINSTNKAVMYYNSRDASGQPIPPPHRENPIQSDPGFLDLLTVSEQGIKGTMGMWESALGQKSNEKTGVAIRARESQADTGNFDWGANLAIAAEHAGNVTDELINKIYDVPTQVRIVGEDDKEEVIWAASLEKDQENPDGYFDLNRGKFDILCKMTPSADTKREETTQGLQALFQSAPELGEILSDFFVQEQDWRLSEKATERIRKFLAMKYPGVVTPEENGKQPPIPPEIQQHMQQMQQQMQQMQQQLQDAQKAVQENQSLKIENQSIKAQKQIEARQLEIEQFKADTDRMKAVGTIDANKDNMLLESDKATHTAAIEVVKLGHDRAKAHSAHELAVSAQEQAAEQAAQAAEVTAADAGNQSTPEDVKEPGSSMEG